jgi:hypothetical protein
MWNLGCAGDVAVTPETCMGYESMHHTIDPSNARRIQKGTDEDKQVTRPTVVCLHCLH